MIFTNKDFWKTVKARKLNFVTENASLIRFRVNKGFSKNLIFSTFFYQIKVMFLSDLRDIFCSKPTHSGEFICLSVI